MREVRLPVFSKKIETTIRSTINNKHCVRLRKSPNILFQQMTNFRFHKQNNVLA